MRKVLRRSESGPGRTRQRLATVLRRAGSLITVELAAEALEVDRTTASKTLSRWTDQGWLKRLRRGTYAPVPPDSINSERTLTNPWLIVPRFFAPGYVGGWSAAEHWHLTEQIFRDVCVFTARRFRNKRILVEGTPFVLHRTEPGRLFGLRTVWEGAIRVPLSDPHRTLIDMLDRPAVGGGIRHVESCFREYLRLPEADLQRLVRYGDQLGSGAVFKRLGFLLERARSGNARAIRACHARITKGNTRLDPALPASRLVTRWRLWVPEAWAEGRR